MMNNSQVAHLWASKNKQSARGSSFYFDGDTIYSYGSHFPIARHCKGVVLFTTRTYSKSTGRHISLTRRAARHIETYHVDDVRREPSGRDLKSYKERIKVLVGIIKSKKNPKWDVSAVIALTAEANQFCQKFGFTTKFNLPAELDEWVAKGEAWEVKRAERDKLKHQRDLDRAAVVIEQWKSGAAVRIPSLVHYIYLRVEGEELVTSHGARVPVLQGKKALLFARVHRLIGGWVSQGNDPFGVGSFQLNEVTDHHVKIGCHTILWDEIERFATAQGW